MLAWAYRNYLEHVTKIFECVSACTTTDHTSSAYFNYKSNKQNVLKTRAGNTVYRNVSVIAPVYHHFPLSSSYTRMTEK
jgi:hypothetical protein